MVGVGESNWNQVKRELITMWRIVKAVREETTVARQASLNYSFEAGKLLL
jgi:hypothetical protein